MKKILSILLAALLVVSMVPTALAADVDVSNGTTIKVVGKGSDTYTATVPAKLVPGESGTVSVSGTWASNQTVNITAPASVDLTYKGQTLNVPITFSGISKAGSDTEAVTASGTLTVGNATALFGTWTGTLNYTVEMVEDSSGDSGSTDSGNTDTGDDDVVTSEGYATFSDGVTLSWDELKLEENGTTYGYDASAITDTSIGNEAFVFCTNLTSIKIPDGITSLGLTAFGDCNNLTNITLPDSLTSIGAMAFSCCNLASITIPDSVSSIGDEAFRGNTNLTTINYAGTIAQWNAIRFGGQYWNEDVPATEVICSDGTVSLS